MSRSRYWWNPETKQLEEVDSDFSGAEKRAQTVTEELVYGGLGCSTDGEAINSRRKHAEYLKRHGLAMASDYREAGPKAVEARKRIASGEADTKQRREAVGRALYEVSRRKHRE